MKRASSFALVFILIFLSLPVTVFAENTGEESIFNIGDEYEGKFLSDSLAYYGMEVNDKDGEYIRLLIAKAGAYIRFDCEAEHGAIPSNRIRMVVDTPANCGILNVEIDYIENGKLKTAFEEIQTGNRAGKKICYLDFDSSFAMTGIKISSPRVLKGYVKLYSLTREYIYEDRSEYIYAEGGNVSASVDLSTKTVSVSGTIGHGTVTKYSGSQIELHRLSAEKQVEDVLSDPSSMIDSKPISIQFRFDVNVTDLSEAYSRYLLVICTEEGERILLESPSVPTNPDKEIADRDENGIYKGVSSGMTIDVIDMNPSLVVVDVFLDKLESPQNSGYYFVEDDKYYYFDREYINELDNKIKAYTDTNCEVYLRFCADTLFESVAPDSDRLKALYVYTSFIAQRYNGGDKGGFSGIIAGDKIDRFKAESRSDIDDRVKLYSMCLYMISEAVHVRDPEVRIFVPVSDVSEINGYDDCPYTSEAFLVSLCEIMDELYISPPAISVMLCGESIPFDIKDAEPQNFAASYDRFTADRISDFELVMSYIRNNSELSVDGYSYLWSPAADLSGSMLTAAYAYNYLKLAFESSAESFIVSLEDGDKLSDLKHVIKYIDTSKFSNAVGPSLEIMGAKSWKELISGFDASKVEKFRLYERAPLDQATLNIKGSRDMWKFSELNSIGAWYSLNGCTSLSINVSSEFGRSLVVKMKPYNEISGQYSGIIYSFDDPNKTSFVDYITYTLGIGCDSTTTEVFEVKLVIGSENEIIESRQIVKAGGLNNITVDIRDIDSVSYIQVNVKPISNQEIPYNLYINKISEQSARYSSEQLEELEENEDDREDDNGNIFSDAPMTGMAIFLLCVVIVFIGLGFVIIFKKIDKNNKNS